MVGGGTSHRGIRTKSTIRRDIVQHWARKRLPRKCREGANSSSVAACQGGQPASASQPRHQGGVTPESLGRVVDQVEAIKKALKKGQEVARERLVVELVKECKDFIELLDVSTS